jgi:hypothetical protein
MDIHSTISIVPYRIGTQHPHALAYPKTGRCQRLHESNGDLLILSCGTEDITSVLAALDEPNSVDTLISILVSSFT